MRELLIEKWFPVHEASIESGRERAGANMLPPLYYLHIWWSRKPQAASRIAAVLSCLPADAYGKEDFKRLLSVMGLRGDPVKAMEAGGRSFGYPVFEGQNPNPSAYMGKAVELWGRKPVGADFMAGGGSIPFEMARAGYGEVVAGEYSPVAYLILKAAIEYPANYGDRVVRDVESYGKQMLRVLRERVKEYYPAHPAGQPVDYVWVRFFRCPECGCETPSLISLWLDRVNGYAFYPEVEGDKVELKVVEVEEIEKIRVGNKNESKVRITEGRLKGTVFDTNGYVQRGVLECPAHRHTVSAEEVKRQYRKALETRERDGYHGSHPARLSAIVFKGRDYSAPTPEMIPAYEAAEEWLKENWERLIEQNLLPTEPIPTGEKTGEPTNMGISRWYGLFNARQLIVHAELVRLIRETRLRVAEDEKRKGRTSEEAEEYGKAIATYLTLALGKTLDYNSIITSWDRGQGSINHTFDQHNFGWTWEYGEGDMVHDPKGIYQWALGNTLKSLKGLIKRINSASRTQVIFGDAAKVDSEAGAYDVILTDPPYYGSIQYGELSDYFYVWFKRTIGDAYPEAFTTVDTPKSEEAVSNRVRHGSTKLSSAAYEQKMTQIFRNTHRLLNDEGVFALWFAHKAGEAWTTTIHALLEAGFTITSLWGVRTEMERSLHISGKAALRTNIIMTCRKRQASGGYIQDALHQLEANLEPRLDELESYGIVGPDFLMAAQAEALKAASSRWPLRDPEGRQAPMEMLSHVMDIATGLAVNHITRKVAPQIVGVDAPTKFYVLSRYLFGDSIPYDDARRLALACTGTTGTGDPVTEIAVDTGLAKLKKEQVEGSPASILIFNKPWDRTREGRVSTQPDAPVIDWIHQAVSTLEEGGSANKAAEYIAQAGGAVCDVLSALYQVLPDQIKEGRATTKNMEKEHVQTLLLTVCQEGLHLQARRRLDEEHAQKRLTDYPTAQPDAKRYDPILDAFIRGQHTHVKVGTPDIDPKTLYTALTQRTAARNLTSTIKVTLQGGIVYLEKTRP